MGRGSRRFRRPSGVAGLGPLRAVALGHSALERQRRRGSLEAVGEVHAPLRLGDAGEVRGHPGQGAHVAIVAADAP
eukprot:3129898-Pyramimonas_sp.AAC.1